MANANPNEAPLLSGSPRASVEVHTFEREHAANFRQIGATVTQSFDALSPAQQAAHNAAEAAHVQTPPTTPPWA